MIPGGARPGATMIDTGPIDARVYTGAILNILEDFTGERERMAEAHRAALNILDDFDTERKRVERVNLDLGKEIAERARVEQALRAATGAAEAASRELETFSYSVAHDLRAPLRSIDGFSQALLEDCGDALDAAGRRYLGNIREGAQHMGALIDDLLNLSQVTRAPIRRESVDLTALARKVLARLRAGNPERAVEDVVEEGLVARADPRLLGIVLTNLLGNAWKFTARREDARIEFRADEPGPVPEFLVRDNGAGFDEKYADKLFGVFQRLHTAGEYEGTGIGLATVQRIVHRHGGRVRAEGRVDRGATFRFTLGGGAA